MWIMKIDFGRCLFSVKKKWMEWVKKTKEKKTDLWLINAYLTRISQDKTKQFQKKVHS